MSTEAIGLAIKALANAITPPGAVASEDAAGIHVGSLTEAMMGVTAGLIAIADAIGGVSNSIDDVANSLGAIADKLEGLE